MKIGEDMGGLTRQWIFGRVCDDADCTGNTQVTLTAQIQELDM